VPDSLEFMPDSVGADGNRPVLEPAPALDSARIAHDSLKIKHDTTKVAPDTAKIKHDTTKVAPADVGADGNRPAPHPAPAPEPAAPAPHPAPQPNKKEVPN
jgi:hypothetical protein